MYVSRPKCALHAPGLFRALLVHSGLRAAALAQDRQRHPVTAHGHKRVFLRAGGPTGADRKVLPLNLVLVLIAPHAPEVERVQAWGGETTFPYGKVTRHYSPRSISANWCSFDFCLFPCRVRRLYRCICDAHISKKSSPFSAKSFRPPASLPSALDAPRGSSARRASASSRLMAPLLAILAMMHIFAAYLPPSYFQRGGSSPACCFPLCNCCRP